MENAPIYQMLLTWSEQQQAAVAEIPELPACTATGATYEAALAAIRKVMQRWIEATQRAGHTLPARQKCPLSEE